MGSEQPSADELAAAVRYGLEDIDPSKLSERGWEILGAVQARLEAIYRARLRENVGDDQPAESEPSREQRRSVSRPLPVLGLVLVAIFVLGASAGIAWFAVWGASHFR